ncbi:MAG: Do family serine endopeptidase, partial [Dokdonella sp.]
VVNINTRTHVQVRDPFFDDPVFRRFFGGGAAQPRERVQQSLGSGVIVDAAKGYVLTNNHVIDGADDVAVTLTDGRTLAGKVIGSDPDTDLAVLQIPAERLSAMPLADVSHLRVGDFVVAVGNPFGIGQTVTSGIVSGLDRTRVGGNRGYQNFIQTDASINPGNSGGPLVDLTGKLVGINSMIFSPSGGNIGIGFAIPIDLAKRVMDQLIQFGEVKRGALGVETQDVTAELSNMLGLASDARGAVVTRIVAGSAADKAGIKVGDTITSFDDKPVRGAQDLHNMEGLADTTAGIRLGLFREGKPVTVAASLQAPVIRKVNGEQLDARLVGAQFADQSNADSQRQVNGAAVLRVDQGSRAFASGLRAGDIVVAVNQRQIGGIDDFQQLAQRQGRQLLLTIARGQSLFYVIVE